MANNRMWICDSKTETRILLAKTMGEGWYMFCSQERFEKFMDGLDLCGSYRSSDGESSIYLEIENNIDPVRQAHEPQGNWANDEFMMLVHHARYLGFIVLNEFVNDVELVAGLEFLRALIGKVATREENQLTRPDPIG